MATTTTEAPARTLKDPSYAFGISFNGAYLTATPSSDESLHDAMIRAIEVHAGVQVESCGRCKRTSDGYYRYPIQLDGGKQVLAFIKASA